jgi:hypothetical protein
MRDSLIVVTFTDWIGVMTILGGLGLLCLLVGAGICWKILTHKDW